VFEGVVVVLIALALILVALQARLTRWLRGREGESRHGRWLLPVGLFAISMYGGYFGAAQGILFIAVLGILVTDDLQRANAIKNILAAVVNGAAAVLFIATAELDWAAAAIIAAGSIIGGQLGARIGRKLPPVALRCAIIAIGLTAIVRIVTR
jgi:hypothetical protein